MKLDIVVLVSIGRHPVSGRARRSPNDARAVELALTLAAEYGGGVRALHAGEPDNPALREYPGMGPAELHVVPVAGGMDVTAPLLETLRRWRPDLILTGMRTECGWSGGCLPYVLAHGLGGALVPNIDAVSVTDDDRLELRQVCPRGRRRLLRTAAPAVISVDPAAPAPRQSAFARARRGRIVTEPVVATTAVSDPGEARPARRRPRRLRAATAGVSAEQRLQSLTGSTGGGQGRLIKPHNADEAARQILDYLVENGVIDSRV